MIDTRSQIRRVYAAIINAVQAKFFGEIYVKFEHGNIVFVKIVENKKPRTTEQALEEIKAFLETRGEGSDIFEYSIRRVKGKPHLTISSKGSVEEVVPIEAINEAEKYRTTVTA